MSSLLKDQSMSKEEGRVEMVERVAKALYRHAWQGSSLVDPDKGEMDAKYLEEAQAAIEAMQEAIVTGKPGMSEWRTDLEVELAIALSRAAHDHCQSRGLDCPHDIGMVLERAARPFIQAAENEILERAANVCECDHDRLGTDEIAEMIRALKHGGSPDGQVPDENPVSFGRAVS